MENYKKSTGLSKDALSQYLGGLDFEVFDSITSTNTYAMELGKKGRRKPLLILADTQSGGRGRMGRSFYSEGGIGLYLTLMLFPHSKNGGAQYITTAAAAALARTVEGVAGIKCDIKWVNDLYLRGRKIAGILTEGSFNPQRGEMDFALLGVGLNVFLPKDGFPNEIKNIAGSLFEENYIDGAEKYPHIRERIAGRFVEEFYKIYNSFPKITYFEEYRDRMLYIGEGVEVIKCDERRDAVIVELCPDFSLLVRYENGETERLGSGEVSVKSFCRG